MDAAVKFPTTPKAVKAAKLKLSKRMSVEQAFEAITRSCLDQIEANEAGVARFHDVESLHQMRVGLRRLHAAFTMFDGVLHAPDAIATELDWLMDELGPARDWDVLLMTTLARVESALPDEPALGALRQAAQERRQAFNARAADAVSSPRFRRFTGSLEQWIDERGWRDELSAKGKMLKARVVDFADALLQKEQQRLIKRGRTLEGATPRERHRVRIAAKRTRYAAEFFASLYPGKRVRPYVAAVRALQDELGSLNDAAVAKRLLAELCEGNDALREGAALVGGYLASRAEAGEPNVRKLWRKMAPNKPPH